MGVWVVDRGSVTEVTNSLTSSLATTKEDGIASLWRAESKLIKGEAFSTSLGDACSALILAKITI